MAKGIPSQLSKPVYLAGALRTPIGRFGGSLLDYPAPELATLCLKAARKKAKDADNPDFVFLGHARQAGGGPNTARQACVFSGISETVPAYTLNHACASGMTAVITGVEKILLGRAKTVWAGGVESMSNTPYLLPQARFGYRMGSLEVVDGMYRDGFHCPMADMVMGATVEEFIAKELKIDRKRQDQFALRSQELAQKAWDAGQTKKEIFEIPAEGKRRPGLSEDEHRRADTNLEKLSKLPSVFDPKKGSVTAGNSSGITDGAAFLRVQESEKGAQVEILDYEMIALDPKRMGLGPIAAISNILSRSKLKIADIEHIEINEAFAAQVLACQDALKIPDEKLNPLGGSIAIGHPIGATGARILVTLIHALANKKGALGIASLCVSGGQGVAVLVRSV